ncbi:acetyltransferase [Pedobacter sp. KBW01]|uniref:DapH/DapD/GlmU-related protein n=1 Tax=Pedobacter sp. KBW01 TaxID=2153364 RepID=UPI000F5A96A1|nr:DapH/DapD/GlmU-related protein [Pedobacter sp. KBW01]RQO65696.1 acetyltransferase [Pedobacter sp. KBW01]
MSTSFINKVKKVTFNWVIITVYSKLRVLKYWMLSDCKRIKGSAIRNSPVITNGMGEILFGNKVNLGVKISPFFLNTYIYLEARNEKAFISIEDGVWINNNAHIISDGPGITIGKDTLIGPNFTAYDSDFHDLRPDKRLTGIPLTGAIVIEQNVFIGSNVTILKGVTVGKNAVIATGSVVTKSIPKNAIAGGNPCKIIKENIAE